ncbi:MAG: chloride channel protein [Planctomycetota bacterium]|nr:chloride channel protein [Planctomycetota bacterium]
MDIAGRVIQWRVKANRLLIDAGFPRDWFLVPIAIAIGLLAGLAAQGYGQLVRLSERLFYGDIGGHELAGMRWWLVLILPVTGAAIVGATKRLFRLPLFSHGIPEVMESLARRKGKLPLRAGLFTALNSAVTIGSGGSAGQEGPIVHIGSVLGSAVGQFLRVGREHMSTLIGCGAAAGLAAIFNAPIAGVLLVLEVILRDFSFKTFMPIVIASVVAVSVSQSLGGDDAALFTLHHGSGTYHFTFGETLPFLVLGMVCGVVGCGFTLTLYAMEHRWKALAWPAAAKPVAGAAALGLMGIAMIGLFPHQIPHYRPTFFGNGYPVVETLLNPATYIPDADHPGARLTLVFLCMVAACKLVGTCATLGTGGSGGLFAPSLFIGAATGGALGLALQSAGLYREVSPATYALAGMAGVLSGAVHCPLTAIILVFEITRDYTLIMPIMLAAIAATTVAQLLHRPSMYTQALGEMGLRADRLSDHAILRRIEVSSVPLAPAAAVFPGDPAQRMIHLAGDRSAFDLVVTDEQGVYQGLVTGEDVRLALLEREALPLTIVADLMRTDLPTVAPDDSLDVVLDRLNRCDVLSLAVVDAQRKVLGTITRSRVMRAYESVAEGTA